MLTVRRSHAKPPSGGHRFPIGEAFVRGETVEEVLTKIEEHRAENSLPLGNPEEDLGTYYRSIAPHLVRGDADASPRPTNAVQIVAEAIMKFWKDHPVIIPIDSPYLQMRRVVCEGCPMMQPFPTGAEGYYAKKAIQRASLLTQDREFQKHGYCGWSRLPVALIVRMGKPGDLERLQDRPKVCWVIEP